MLEHLEEDEGRDVNLLGGAEKRGIGRWVAHAAGAGAGEDPLQALHRLPAPCVASLLLHASAFSTSLIRF